MSATWTRSGNGAGVSSAAPSCGMVRDGAAASEASSAAGEGGVQHGATAGGVGAGPRISAAAARARILAAKRVVVKVGTSVVSSKTGHLALGRMGAIIEQICRLVRAGKEVILVSSGAVGIGRRRLSHRFMLTQSLGSLVHAGGATELGSDLPRGAGSQGDGDEGDDDDDTFSPAAVNLRSCAAAGQSGLMSLYDIFFGEYGIGVSQILVTDADFSNCASRRAFRGTVENLLRLGVVPVLNENDAISTRHTPLRDENNRIFWDNDSLAGLVAAEVNAEALLLLTDVDGLCVHTAFMAEA